MTADSAANIKNIIILGAGRSGTSLLAGLMPEQYYKGASLVKAWKANPKGFFEDKEVNRINEVLISQITPNKLTYRNLKKGVRHKFHWKKGYDYGERWLYPGPPEGEDISMTPDNQLQSAMKRVLANQPFCLKDPRFSLTLSGWNPLLPSDTHKICVFREPVVSAQSMVKFKREQPGSASFDLSLDSALDIWQGQNQSILNNYRESPKNWTFIHYDQLADPQWITHFSERLGVKLQSGFYDSSLKRTQNGGQAVSSAVQKVYDQLCELAGYL